MADLVVLTPEQLRVLHEQIGAASVVVVTTDEALKAAGIEIDEAYDYVEEYDCGGDADLWIDWATKPEHYFFTFLKERQGGE